MIEKGGQGAVPALNAIGLFSNCTSRAFNRRHNPDLAGDAGIGGAGQCSEAEHTETEVEKIHRSKARLAAVRYL